MSNILKQSKRKFHIIYKITNLLNNMIYIGAHSTDLVDDEYYGSGFRLTLAIEKYGKANFKKEILYIFDSPNKMFEKEKELVNTNYLKRTDVYNIVEGGFGGFNKGSTGLKHLHHPQTSARCAVHTTAVNNMLKEGWVVGRNMSSTTNTIWVHKGKEKKMILPELFKEYKTNGWIKGLPTSPTRGKIWIYNFATSKYSLCEKNKLDDNLSLGWIKKKWTPVEKGCCWINNGKNNLRISKDMFGSYISQGWKKGMLTTRWQ
jgi:hypothetical protein